MTLKSSRSSQSGEVLNQLMVQPVLPQSHTSAALKTQPFKTLILTTETHFEGHRPEAQINFGAIQTSFTT